MRSCAQRPCVASSLGPAPKVRRYPAQLRRLPQGAPHVPPLDKRTSSHSGESFTYVLRVERLWKYQRTASSAAKARRRCARVRLDRPAGRNCPTLGACALAQGVKSRVETWHGSVQVAVSHSAAAMSDAKNASTRRRCSRTWSALQRLPSQRTRKSSRRSLVRRSTV